MHGIEEAALPEPIGHGKQDPGLDVATTAWRRPGRAGATDISEPWSARRGVAREDQQATPAAEGVP